MKTRFWFVLAIAIASSRLSAQVSIPPATNDPPGSAPSPVDVGPNHRTWATPTADTNVPGGRPNAGITNRPDAQHRVVEIATGMNYWDGKQWVPSDPTFELASEGFVAAKLQHRVRLADNLNKIGAVTVTTRDG